MRGLSFDAYEDDIKEFFVDCGEIQSVNLLKNTDGRSKGIAFVRFNDEESIANAVNQSGAEHMGRNITIEKTKPREARPAG